MKKSLLLLLLLALLGAAYAYYQFNRPNANLGNVKEDVTLSAKDLLTAFQTDETAAGTKYTDKVIAIKGIVSNVQNENNVIKLSLETGDPMSTVLCELDPSSAEKAKSVIEGSEIKIKGMCTGFLSDVVLTRCVIQ